MYIMKISHYPRHGRCKLVSRDFNYTANAYINCQASKFECTSECKYSKKKYVYKLVSQNYHKTMFAERWRCE